MAPPFAYVKLTALDAQQEARNRTRERLLQRYREKQAAQRERKLAETQATIARLTEEIDALREQSEANIAAISEATSTAFDGRWVHFSIDWGAGGSAFYPIDFGPTDDHDYSDEDW